MMRTQEIEVSTGPEPRQRWVTSMTITQRASKVHVASLDEDWRVQPLLTLENTLQYYENSVSEDGNFRTAVVFPKDGDMQLWLLDLPGGKAHLLAEDTSVRGDVSPDGKTVLVNTRHREGEGFLNHIEIQDTSGKTIKSLGEGFLPFWVWP
jgi:hypothetical protein